MSRGACVSENSRYIYGMNSSLNAPSVSLADAELRYKDAAQTILEAYARLPEAPLDQVNPGQLHAAIEQFFLRSAQLNHADKTVRLRAREEVSQLGDYGVTMLMDLGAWAHRLGLSDLESEFDTIALAFADWVVRNGGEIRTIEPVVDALASQANQVRDPQMLERLTHLTTRIIRAIAPEARTTFDRRYPNPPWRMLNLNYGIVATRTHNPALMEHVFEELVRNVPAEAPRFFAEGMQQMEKFNFPFPVRAVMARYFDRWTRPRMN